ncbi:hypothetical protein [Xanthomonas cassavae]|nr:hypothetical protein [Xanthomonas cassavae]
MSNFRKSLPNMGDDGLYARLRRWTAGNSLGWVRIGCHVMVDDQCLAKSQQ